MNRSKELAYNSILIIVVIVLRVLSNFVFGYKEFGEISFSLSVFSLTFFVPLLSVYSLNYLIATPRFLIKKKYGLYLLSFLAMILVFGVLRFVLEEVIVFNIYGIHNYNLEAENIVETYLFDSFYYTLLASIPSTIVCFLFRFNENREELHQLQIEHQEAKMMTLKSQLSPHFLFNTLNNFYGELFDEKPEVANAILKLSQLLRYVTYETEKDFMPLEKEVSFIKDYLYFFKRRYETHFFVDLKIEGQITNQTVPTLILLHFVENVCKHGIINQKEKPAKIVISVTDKYLSINTENSISTSDKYMDKGIGTTNIVARLQVLYKDRFELITETKDTVFTAFLKIPLDYNE